MTSVRGLEKFIELQDKIIELLNQEAQDLRKRFLSSENIFNVFCGISFFSYIFIALISSFIFADMLISLIITSIFRLESSLWSRIILMICRFVVGFVIFGFVLKIINFILNISILKNEEYRYLEFAWGIIFAIPLFVLLSIFVIDILVSFGANILNITSIFVVVLLMSFSILYVSSFMILFFLFFTPAGFFSMLTSSEFARPRNNHDAIVIKISKKINKETTKWHGEDFINVNLIAENKKVNLTSQLQSTTIILTTLTLFGILISFVPLEITKALFDVLDNLLAQIVQYFTGVEESYEGSTEIYVQSIAFIILGFIVFIAYSYFLESYKVLRAIEIIQLICHSEITKAQQQESSVLRNISMKARLLARLLLDSDISSKP